MNYTITEDEYSALDAARAQLDLVAHLLEAQGKHSSGFSAADLCAFLSERAHTIWGVIEAVDARQKAAKEADNTMSWLDWSAIIGVVSGRRRMLGGDLKKLGCKLQNSAKVDPDMEHVFDIWMDVMTEGGTLNYSLEPTISDGFVIAFPERAPVTQTPAPMAPAKKAAPRKREKLAAAT